MHSISYHNYTRVTVYGSLYVLVTLYISLYMYWCHGNLMAEFEFFWMVHVYTISVITVLYKNVFQVSNMYPVVRRLH